MKKTLITAIILGLIFVSGCTKSTDATNTTGSTNTTEQSSDESDSLAKSETDTANDKTNSSDESSDKDANKTPDSNEASDTKGAETVSNSFFFKNTVSKVTFKGNLSFDSPSVIEKDKDVILNVNKLADLNQGTLYELKLDPIDNIRSERLALGYLYVQKDKIYKIGASSENDKYVSPEENANKLKATGELPKDNMIVCHDDGVKDSLGKDDPSYHNYVEVDGDKRIFHFYKNDGSTSYYESFTWQKDKGLVAYRSGYGAGRDSMELQIK